MIRVTNPHTCPENHNITMIGYFQLKNKRKLDDDYNQFDVYRCNKDDLNSIKAWFCMKCNWIQPISGNVPQD